MPYWVKEYIYTALIVLALWLVFLNADPGWMATVITWIYDSFFKILPANLQPYAMMILATLCLLLLFVFGGNRRINIFLLLLLLVCLPDIQQPWVDWPVNWATDWVASYRSIPPGPAVHNLYNAIHRPVSFGVWVVLAVVVVVALLWCNKKLKRS